MRMKKTQASPDGGQPANAAGQPDFEAALVRLEEIVERLDDGNLPLAESLALFKEGTGLAKICRSLLSDAEVQVKTALQDVQTEADERYADNPAQDSDFEDGAR